MIFLNFQNIIELSIKHRPINQRLWGIMSGTTSFSDYHPSWEGREFNKEEYESLLEELASKTSHSSTLMLEDHSFKVVGPIMHVWQKIKGWFGFENRTDPIKVNYELLKLLRYGKNHHFLENDKIRSLLKTFKRTLDSEYQHEKVANVVGDLINKKEGSVNLDNEVKVYYKTHIKELHEPFWPKLFHHYTSPVVHNTALVQFNLGRIYASEGNLKEALVNMQNALEVSSENSGWHLEFADIALKYVEQLWENDEFDSAKTLIGKILKTLQSQNLPLDKIDHKETLEKISTAYTYLCAIHIKQGKLDAGLGVLQKGEKYLHEKQGSPQKGALLASYETLIERSESITPSLTNLGEFYLLLAAQETDLDLKEAKLIKAVEALKSAKDPSNQGKVIEASLQISEILIANHQLDQAHSINKELFAQVEKSPTLLNDNIFSRLTLSSEQLYKAFRDNPSTSQRFEILNNLQRLHAPYPMKAAYYHYESGRLHSYSNDFISALREFELAYSLHPIPEYHAELKKIIQTLADLALKNGSLHQAIIYYDKLHVLSPKDWFPLHQLATIHSNLSNWPQANECCQQLLVAYPNHLDAYILTSKTYQRQGKLSEAISYAQKAVDLSPENPEAFILLFDLTGTAQTPETYLKILETRPNDWRIHAKLGELYRVQKNYAQAKEYLSNAVLLDNTHPGVFATLGKVAMEEKNYPLAIKYYLHASELGTSESFENELSTCHQILAQQALNSKNHAEMLNHYQHALNVAPSKSAMIASELVACGDHLIDGDKLTALASYRMALPYLNNKVIETNRLTEIYLKLAADERSRQSYEGAIQNLLYARELDPQHAGVLKELAGCYIDLGRHKEAQDIYEQMINLGHSTAEIYAFQGTQLLQQKEFEKAINSFEKAAEHSLENSHYEKEITICLLKLAEIEEQKAPEGALKIYEKALLRKNADKNLLTTNLLAFADKQKTCQNLQMATNAYKLALTHLPPHSTFVDSKKRSEIYAFLSLVANIAHTYQEGENYAKEALKIDSNNVDALMQLSVSLKNLGRFQEMEAPLSSAITLNSQQPLTLTLLAELYRQEGKADKAVDMYRKALSLTPQDQTLIQALYQTEIEAGDLSYNFGSFDPSKFNTDTVETINFILNSPYAKEITNALGYWKKENSSENIALQSLKNPLKKMPIAKACKKAIQLIETAYDGRSHHLKSEKMPPEIRQRLDMLKTNEKYIDAYYTRLDKETSALAKIGREMNYSKMDPGATLSDPEMIENRALSLIKEIEGKTRSWFSSKTLPSELKEKVEMLKQVMSPSQAVNMEQAVIHYLAAYQLFPQKNFQDYMNRLIDALIKSNRSDLATKYYEILSAQFPSRITPNAEIFLAKIKSMVILKQFNNALTLVGNLINQYPSEVKFKKGLSDIYVALGDESARKGEEKETIKNYQNALECGVTADASCYSKLGKIYYDLYLQEKAVSKNADSVDPGKSYRDFADKNLEMATNADPENYQYLIDYGRFIFHEMRMTMKMEYKPYFLKAKLITDKLQKENQKVDEHVLSTIQSFLDQAAS